MKVGEDDSSLETADDNASSTIQKPALTPTVTPVSSLTSPVTPSKPPVVVNPPPVLSTPTTPPPAKQVAPPLGKPTS